MPSFQYEGQDVHWVGNYTGSFGVIHQGLFYEQPFLEAVRSLGLRGTYLDIGSNVGTHAVYFGLFCADRVIGFEPVDRWRKHAQMNVEANGLSGTVEIRGEGLLDADKVILFDIAGPGTLLHCRALDDVLPDLGGVTFVKMDIEGSEPKALLGGREFFQRNRPVIAAEVLGSTDELAAAAEAIGYRLTGNIFPSTPGSPMYELGPEG